MDERYKKRRGEKQKKIRDKTVDVLSSAECVVAGDRGRQQSRMTLVLEPVRKKIQKIYHHGWATVVGGIFGTYDIKMDLIYNLRCTTINHCKRKTILRPEFSWTCFEMPE